MATDSSSIVMIDLMSKNNQSFVDGSLKIPAATDPLFQIRQGDTKRRPRRSSSSLYRGVQLKNSRQYAAKILHPIQGRKWLGTFDTPDEASRVYEAKRREFEAMDSVIVSPYSSSLGGRARKKIPF